MIDLTTPPKTFIVPTTKIREGVAYMGEDVKVNARDEAHAKQLVKDAGFRINQNFEVREVKHAEDI